MNPNAPRFYANPVGSNVYTDHWGRGNVQNGGPYFQPPPLRQSSFPQRLNEQWNDTTQSNVITAMRTWSQQGPRDEHLERELFSGINSGINFDKYEEIPVEATGSDVPPPINDFSELPLHPWIQENIRKSGYTKPTPVQKYSIPSLLKQRHLMSCAQTGSGKTAAFLIPLINEILKNGPGSIRPV
ncbi:hypothetical protein AB6A40_007964 [Gnathostoma spinigerum]|uniref:RNA helicase n=1 Tax=Gnathostoma spinigerum TaxID=75299 RepID=A0ABD6EYC5_9BILA